MPHQLKDEENDGKRAETEQNDGEDGNTTNSNDEVDWGTKGVPEQNSSVANDKAKKKQKN